MSASPTDLHQEYLARRVFGSLDGFRCLSIVVVIWHHAHGGIDGVPGSFRGFLGVDMFFVISGFLIVTLLLRERDRGSISLGRFYARRTLRIFPIYYAILGGLFVLYTFVSPGSARAPDFHRELPYYLTYTSNWIVASILPITWSLAAEEQFYLLWPPMEKFLRRAVIPFLIVFVVFNQLINFRVIETFFEGLTGLDYDEHEILQATFTPICFGVLLAHTLHSERGFAQFRRWLGHRFAPVGLLGLVVLVGNIPGDISGGLRLSIDVAMAALLASCVVREDHVLAQSLRWLPVRRIGVVSYGMYLYHLFVLHVLLKLEIASPWLRFVGCLVGTWVVSELSFRYFESRFLALKHRFAARGSTAPVAEEVVAASSGDSGPGG